MTRIPPGITKVFKRILSQKPKPDQQQRTTTAQLTTPQKAVRFSQDIEVRYIDEKKDIKSPDHEIIPAKVEPTNTDQKHVQDLATTGSETREGQKSSKPRHIFENQIDQYLNEIEKNNEDITSRFETIGQQIHRIEKSNPQYTQETKKPVSPKDQLDHFLNALESESMMSASVGTNGPDGRLSSEQKQDAIRDIQLQQVTGKNV